MFLGPSKTVVEPTEEPVTLQEAKTHLRVDHDADDTLIMGLIATARRSCEFGARRSFVTQTREMALCAWPPASGFQLPMPPLKESGREGLQVGMDALLIGGSERHADHRGENTQGNEACHNGCDQPLRPTTPPRKRQAPHVISKKP